MTTATSGMKNVVPVARDTVQSRVYEDLKRRLLLGELKPGQALKINGLAEMFGTSAQPVRETIRQLIAERALEAAANRSARVPRLDSLQLDDLRRTRLAVEGLATELAAERGSASQIAGLKEIALGGLHADEAASVADSVAQNLTFHFELYRISGSKELPPIIESLWLRLGPLIRSAAERFDARDGRGVEMHLAAVEAMARRDVAGARAAIEADINRFFEVVRQKGLN